VDELNSKNCITQSLIVDIKTKTITALSPNLKLYTSVETEKASPMPATDFETIKTRKFKYINGLKCYFWKMRSKRMNTEIAYWVYESDFTFFNTFIDILSKSSDYAKYAYPFYQIQMSGFIPVESIERNLVREKRSRLFLKSIRQCQMSKTIFKVPTGYRNLASL
jgi:hypothetical protein